MIDRVGMRDVSLSLVILVCGVIGLNMFEMSDMIFIPQHSFFMFSCTNIISMTCQGLSNITLQNDLIFIATQQDR